VLDAFAVAAQAGGAAVEEGRVLRRGSVFGPVPILKRLLAYGVTFRRRDVRAGSLCSRTHRAELSRKST
jgi:hypothetical protein